MRILRTHIALLARRLALLWLALALCRAVFYLSTLPFLGAAELRGGVLIDLLRGAFKFDTVSVLYVNAPFILLSLVPLHLRERRWWQSMTYWYYMIVNSTAIVAGSSAASNIEGFVYVCPSSFYQAALTFTSQNYGAGKCGRVDRILLLCQAYVLSIGLVLGGLAVLFGHPLISIYAPGEEEVIAHAMVRLKYVCSLYCLCGVMDVMVGALRGLGYSVVPMIVSMVGACGVRLLWVATIFQVYHTPAVLYLSYPVSWTITAAVHIGFFFCIRKRAYAKCGIHGMRPDDLPPEKARQAGTE